MRHSWTTSGCSARNPRLLLLVLCHGRATPTHRGDGHERASGGGGDRATTGPARQHYGHTATWGPRAPLLGLPDAHTLPHSGAHAGSESGCQAATQAATPGTGCSAATWRRRPPRAAQLLAQSLTSVEARVNARGAPREEGASLGHTLCRSL